MKSNDYDVTVLASQTCCLLEEASALKLGRLEHSLENSLVRWVHSSGKVSDQSVSA